MSGARPLLRVVPADPDPGEFPFVPFACDLRPHKCGGCARLGTYFCIPTKRGEPRRSLFPEDLDAS